MDLEEQIARITNPQDFTKLCNTVFTAEYDNNFQVIDGTRGDEGNDGYISSEKRVLAIYCPIKPDKKTDRDFEVKIASDLKKAASLRNNDTLPVECWTFVTPRKLPASIITFMHKRASEYGLTANHLESTYLSGVLYKHEHLIQKFPYLQISRLEGLIRQWMSRFESRDKNASEQTSDPSQVKPDGLPSDDLSRVIQIRSQAQTASSKSELRTIFYKTGDIYAKLNVICGLIQWFDPVEDKPVDMVEWCNIGIGLAMTQEDRPIKAYFLGHKGEHLSMQWSYEDMQFAMAARVTNIIGIQIHIEEERKHTIERLRAIDHQAETAFNEALEIARDLTNVNLYAEVLLCIGVSSGLRFMDYNLFGMLAEAQREKALAKRSLLGALRIYSETGQELNKAYAMHNLANQLRFFGESEEALRLENEVIAIARKYNNASLLQAAEGLRETLITGKIPNYAIGERQPRKK
ncbi:MAG: tetratricopeptide repeat protein [Kiritimatiellae bacterium]|nr:tetratricopeptide repeat protein [Kiritimatiellia bacterium]